MNKIIHRCAYCDAIKIRWWRKFEVVNEEVENDDGDCDHEWEDGEYV